MSPFLNEGDIVVFKKIKQINANELKKGSILLLNHPFINNHLIIKRLINCNSEGVYVQGDNLLFSDDSRNFGWIQINNVVGITERIFRNSINNLS